MKKIGIIIASTRENRVGKMVADWVLQQVEVSSTMNYSLIDLKEINLPLLDEPYPAAAANYQHEHTKKWAQKVSEFDGFVIVTPEYNHGYPAALKNALDYLYAEWHNKPVAFIGYGYSANGARSIEQLRQVVSYLQLKALWNDVVINLATSLKDGAFLANDPLGEQVKKLLKNLESTLK